MPAARLLQRTFSSWQDLGGNYMMGREFWSPEDPESIVGANLDYTYRSMVLSSDSPWRRIPWGLDLSEGAPPGKLASSQPTESSASVYLVSRPAGLTCFALTVIDRPRTPAAVDGVRKMLGCQTLSVTSDTQTGRDWDFRGECVQPDFAKRAAIHATYPLEPLAAALRAQQVTQMFVQITHSVTANSRLTPPAKYQWFRDGNEENVATFDLSDPAPSPVVQYGYTDAQQDQLYESAGLFSVVALLMASALAVFSRRGEVWSSFWRAQIVMPCLIWSGWLLLVTGQDGLPLVRLASGREGVVGALPTIAKLCLAPFALQFAASLIVFPAYRRLRGVEISWLQAGRAAFWRSALPAPMAALLFLVTDPQVIMIPALAIGAAILCAVLQFWFLHNLLHALRIGGLKVAEGELRERVFALAAKANAPLRRFCIIPEGAWKSVHALTTGDRSLLIAQPVIDQLSRPEVDAVIAHELAHMRLKHRAWAIVQVIACAVVVFLLESRIPREQGLVVILVLMAGLLAGIVSVNFFRRRADYAADRLAVKLIGMPEPLITAILRLDRLRGCPLYWSPAEELLFGHSSALGRVSAIARRNGVSKDRLGELIASKPAESIDPYPIPAFASTRLVYLM